MYSLKLSFFGFKNVIKILHLRLINVQIYRSNHEPIFLQNGYMNNLAIVNNLALNKKLSTTKFDCNKIFFSND
jgi:hypothetical protein